MNRFKRPVAIVALALLSCICSSSLFDKNAFGQDLQWKLQKGQRFSLVTDQKMVTKMNVPGAGLQEMPMNQSAEVEWKVTDSDDKTFVVQQTIKRMKISMKSAFVNVDYDSDGEPSTDPVTKQIAKGMEQLIGVAISSKMSRQGKVLEVMLPEELANKPADPASPLSGDTLKQMFEQATIDFPSDITKVGKTWKQSAEINLNGMKMKTDVTYRYDGQVEVDGRKLEKFNLESFVTLSEPPPGIDMTVEDNGSGGEILFDAKTGCIVSTKLTQNMKMKIKVAGQTIDQDLQGVTTTTVTPISE